MKEAGEEGDDEVQRGEGEHQQHPVTGDDAGLAEVGGEGACGVPQLAIGQGVGDAEEGEGGVGGGGGGVEPAEGGFVGLEGDGL